jgi:sulfopyruvate decarboxylase TPP-binding subunit
MFSGDRVASLFSRCGITHVVMVPDHTLGEWVPALRGAGIRVVSVCREGEAWAVAAGLYLGGSQPLVMLQCTGLFESGDSLRNVLHDWKLPIFSVIGYRSYLNQQRLPGDTALLLTEPTLNAWQIDYRLVTAPDQFDTFAAHLDACRRAGKAGAVLIAEG